MRSRPFLRLRPLCLSQTQILLAPETQSARKTRQHAGRVWEVGCAAGRSDTDDDYIDDDDDDDAGDDDDDCDEDFDGDNDELW